VRRELKRQIKQDEFRSGMETVFEWTRQHAREVQVTVLAVAVLFGAGAIVQNFRERQENAAQSAFGAALETFHAPLAAEIPAGTPRPVTSFATREEKYRKAATEFEGVEKTAAGDIRERARYYGALSRIELGELDAAEKTLTDLASRHEKDDLVPSLARLALADVFRRRGQPQKAVEAYRRMLDDSSFLLPRDHVLLKLAGTLEETNDLKEARASYERLVQDYPGSVYAGEARQRADYLQSARG
jgi:tetratricopeptide (TPR) repeat protein